MKTKLFVLLIMAAFASEEYENDEKGPNFGETLIGNENTENLIVVKIEESEYAKTKVTSHYIGVSYKHSKWCVQRWSRNEKKDVCYGSYGDIKTAAHASDTLARKFMEKGEQGHTLNFPDDHTEVHKKTATSDYIGVNFEGKKWRVQRWNKQENKLVSNGSYNNEKTAALASDTLARELMDNGEHGHRLNFPNDHTEVHPEKTATSEYIGVGSLVGYKHSKWYAQRWSKNEKKNVFYGYYDNEETAALASDTLARELMNNGEQAHMLNFPGDKTEVHSKEYQKKKRKRKDNFQDK